MFLFIILYEHLTFAINIDSDLSSLYAPIPHSVANSSTKKTTNKLTNREPLFENIGGKVQKVRNVAMRPIEKKELVAKASSFLANQSERRAVVAVTPGRVPQLYYQKI